MLELKFTRNGAIAVGGVDDGAEAYVDADWIRLGRHAPALVVSADGALSFGGRVLAPRRRGDAARSVLAGLIQQALERVALIEGPVEVTGSGVVAQGVRLKLGPRNAVRMETAPAAVVDTTGAPATIAGALGRLRQLGTLVLAGEPLDRDFTLDLYPDVHVRGLHVVGVETLLAGDVLGPEPDPELDELLDRTLAHATLGELLDVRAPWYCITA